MARERGGASRQRCRRDGLFVDGVKVPTDRHGADIVWLDGSTVRKVTPASFQRIMRGREGYLPVMVVPSGAKVDPAWFDEDHGRMAVWRGRLFSDADAARSRRRVRAVGYWDDRNLLACVNFIEDHPDPSVPEQRLLAKAALAAAEARQVEFVRRRSNLESLVRSGERSRAVSRGLDVVRMLQHGSASFPLEPTEDRSVLRRRATRLLNRSEAASSRLQSVASLDRHGAALAVASRAASLDQRRALDAALKLTAAAAATNVAYLVATPEAGLWAYRTLATLSVFARANSRTIERDTSPARSVEREERFRRDHELLSRSAPDAILADAATHGVRTGAGFQGLPHEKVSVASMSAAKHLAESVQVSAASTAALVEERKVGVMARNLVGSLSVVGLYAKAAALVAALNEDLSPAGVEVASAVMLGSSAALVGRSRNPGTVLAREARAVRRTFERSRASRKVQEDVLSALPPLKVSYSSVRPHGEQPASAARLREDDLSADPA